MRLRFYKHDVDFVDLELGGDAVGMGMKFITVSFSSSHARVFRRPSLLMRSVVSRCINVYASI